MHNDKPHVPIICCIHNPAKKTNHFKHRLDQLENVIESKVEQNLKTAKLHKYFRNVPQNEPIRKQQFVLAFVNQKKEMQTEK